jgi:hypothetical protein
MFKSASKGIESTIKFIEDTKSMKSDPKEKEVKVEDPEAELDVDTDLAQEQIANATGEGMMDGAEEGAKAMAKKIAQQLKEIKTEVQQEIADRIKDQIKDVVDVLKSGLEKQKEASLAVYDAQIQKIEDVAKAEDRLTKEQEYQNKMREAEEQRMLNRMNNRRNYLMAVYAGQIDEARAIADEGARQETVDTRSIGEIQEERAKELAEQNRKDLIDSIKDTRKIAQDYFDDMIKNFTDAAKKITEFPPTTAEEFNTQLNELAGIATTAANSIGTNFSESFNGVLATLGVNADGPLTSSLEAISATLIKNNPFGEDGIWNKTIDAAIDSLTRKYQGLTNTLTTVIDDKSDAFKTLFETYKKYKALVDEGTGDGAGSGAGAGTTGGGPGGTPSTGGSTDESKVAGYSREKINAYISTYLSKAYGQDSHSRQIPAAVRSLVTDIVNSSLIVGDYSQAYRELSGATARNKYPTAVANSSRGVYDHIMKNKSSFKSRAIGGVIPYGQGGPTMGPVQQSIPAILHGGEYVVRNSAVKKYGWGMMDQINKGSFNPKEYFLGGIVDKAKKTIFNVANIIKKGKKQTGISSVDKNIQTAVINPSKMALEFSGAMDLYKGIKPGASLSDKAMALSVAFSPAIGVGIGKVAGKIAGKVKKIKNIFPKNKKLTEAQKTDEWVKNFLEQTQKNIEEMNASSGQSMTPLIDLPIPEIPTTTNIESLRNIQELVSNISSSTDLVPINQFKNFIEDTMPSNNRLTMLARGIDLDRIIQAGVIDSKLAQDSGYIGNRNIMEQVGQTAGGFERYNEIRERMESLYGPLRGNANYGIVRRADDFTTASSYTQFRINIDEMGQFLGSELGAKIYNYQQQMDKLLGQVYIDIRRSKRMTYTVGDSWNMYNRSRYRIEPGYNYISDNIKAPRMPVNIDEVPLAHMYGEEIVPSFGDYTEMQFPRIAFNRDNIRAVTILRDPDDSYHRGKAVYGWGAEGVNFVGLQETIMMQRELAKRVKELGIQVRTGIRGKFWQDPKTSPIYDKKPLSDLTDKEVETMLRRVLNKSRIAQIKEERRIARMPKIEMPDFFNGGLMPSLINGGVVPGFESQGIPAMLHGGEYVVNAKAVKNIGFAALEAMNNMRYSTPKSPSYSATTNQPTNSNSNVNIYVDNFIGERAWFESMMKDYNVKVAPQNQKSAGLNNTTISTYSGINRGL